MIIVRPSRIVNVVGWTTSRLALLAVFAARGALPGGCFQPMYGESNDRRALRSATGCPAWIFRP